MTLFLKQEQTSIFITKKLYSEFVSNNINESDIEKFSKIFRESNYDISVLLREILLSDSFWNNKSNMIKSPVELIVSFVKSNDLRLKEKDYKFILKRASILGQNVFDPPNVKGWVEGKAWIDTTSLLNRKELIRKVDKKKVQ